MTATRRRAPVRARCWRLTVPPVPLAPRPVAIAPSPAAPGHAPAPMADVEALAREVGSAGAVWLNPGTGKVVVRRGGTAPGAGVDFNSQNNNPRSNNPS